MAPAPSFKHQKVITRLIHLISNHVFEKKTGEVIVTPIDVVLDDDMVLQPDIIFISCENRKIIKDTGIFGAPDLVIEVLSPASIYRDMKVKKGIYERFGVREYWIVFPDERVVEIFTLNQGRYTLTSSVEKDGSIRSAVLSMEMDIKDILPAHDS